uniref:Uncharacterized protein n=1 Tax=Glossina austeni TaxID=7395 RepID=A0A1A9UXS2_GLOAU
MQKHSKVAVPKHNSREACLSAATAIRHQNARMSLKRHVGPPPVASSNTGALGRQNNSLILTSSSSLRSALAHLTLLAAMQFFRLALSAMPRLIETIVENIENSIP